jgi:hypothetical protein
MAGSATFEFRVSESRAPEFMVAGAVKRRPGGDAEARRRLEISSNGRRGLSMALGSGVVFVFGSMGPPLHREREGERERERRSRENWRKGQREADLISGEGGGNLELLVSNWRQRRCRLHIRPQHPPGPPPPPAFAPAGAASPSGPRTRRHQCPPPMKRERVGREREREREGGSD